MEENTYGGKYFLILDDDTFKYCDYVKCLNGGTCILDQPSVFKPIIQTTKICSCLDGFYGTYCENQLQCGYCFDGKCNSQFGCDKCSAGLTGTQCDFKSCTGYNMCQNGGFCL